MKCGYPKQTVEWWRFKRFPAVNSGREVVVRCAMRQILELVYLTSRRPIHRQLTVSATRTAKRFRVCSAAR